MSERDYVYALGEAEQQEHLLAERCRLKMLALGWSPARCDTQWDVWYDLSHCERWQAMTAFALQ